MYLNAFSATKPKIATGRKTNKVIHGFILMSSTTDIIAVIVPPTSCTSPVPIRLRTPSTSLIILDTSAPDLLLSKKLIGNESIFFCTCARNSLIRYCACTLKIRVNKKEVTA